ncbi:MAG: RDD family protein [Planctomycetota bacterium]
MHQNSEKLDCYARVITPENIEFEYALAGPLQRLPAFLFDVVVRAVVCFALIIFGWALFAFVPFGIPIYTIGLTILFFLLSWFYGVYFETRFNGRTLGKMVFKLRTISVDGRPINAAQAGLRNMLRLADLSFLLPLQIFGNDLPPNGFFPTFVVGMLCMVVTRRMQRIGDLAAGTMVVSESSQRSPLNLKPEDLRAYGLAELIPANFQASASLAKTIGLYMENRKRLSALRRNDVARHLALPLLSKFEMMKDTSPDLLLCAMYVRTFLSEGEREEGRRQMRMQDNPALGTPRPAMPVVQTSAPSPLAVPLGTVSPQSPTMAAAAPTRPQSPISTVQTSADPPESTGAEGQDAQGLPQGSPAPRPKSPDSEPPSPTQLWE